MSINYMTPTADWLAISYAASHSPYLELDSIFSQLGVICHKQLPKRSIYQFVDGGSAHCMLDSEFHNFSFSGGCLDVIRKLNLFNELTSILMLYPSNITRLDIAYDMPIPFPSYHRKLDILYPDGIVEVLGKERKSITILSNCPRTNVPTGTYYFQNKDYKGHTKIRVYDKSNEVFERENEVIKPTTRIEITLGRSVGLRDLVSPSSAFWYHLPDKLLKSPEDVSPFVKTPRLTLVNSETPDLTPFQKFETLIEHSAFLAHIRSGMAGKPLADRRAFRLSILTYFNLHDII